MKTKRVLLNATVLNPTIEDEFREEIEFEITIPESEWARLINEGNFSHYFEHVIDGYQKYLKELTGYNCFICYEEIKGE